MKKITKFVLPSLAGLIAPLTVWAVNFTNPADKYLVNFANRTGGNTFAGILLFIVQALLGIVGLLSVLFIILGGFQYITSRGDEEAATTGKKTLTNAIIGLVVTIFSYIIVVVIMNAFFGKV